MTEEISLLPNENGVYGAIRNHFWRAWLADPTLHTVYRQWQSDADWQTIWDSLPAGYELDNQTVSLTRFFVDGDLKVFVGFDKDNHWALTVSGPRDQAVAYSDAFLKRVPQIENNDEDVIPIMFWTLNAKHEPESVLRKIDSHKWSEIRDNYPMDVRARLDEVMELSAPTGSGKLVLWHGPPGTGKTNCIRALAHAWRGWCDVDYVVDPEALFGHAFYMMSALVNGRNNADRWRLIVIEDSGEFLRKDAKAQQGQSFGRLLNLTDGLVGQGLKLIILVTTNEPFGDLHPAIARPGRCLSHLEFGLFPPDEASKWLGQRVSDGLSLADLYEARAEVQPQITKDHEEFRPGLYV